VAAPLFAVAPAQAATLAVPQGQSVSDFYAIRSQQPLWFQNGQPTAAALTGLRPPHPRRGWPQNP